MKNKHSTKKFQFILFPLLLILSACGGGGGGGSGSLPRSVAACTDTGTAFQTAEYYALGNTVVGRGLSKICASNAYARGYTGSGVKVGILDTGITTAAHQEFDGSGKRNYDSIRFDQDKLIHFMDADGFLVARYLKDFTFNENVNGATRNWKA